MYKVHTTCIASTVPDKLRFLLGGLKFRRRSRGIPLVPWCVEVLSPQPLTGLLLIHGGTSSCTGGAGREPRNLNKSCHKSIQY